VFGLERTGICVKVGVLLWVGFGLCFWLWWRNVRNGLFVGSVALALGLEVFY
jgi:hypothetical protein